MEELLIEKVREHEVLYNTKLPKYREPHIRQAAWQEIGRDINMKAETAKYNWDKLRRCFLNAINRRRNKNRIHGTSNGPAWKYDEQMSFLLPHIGSRKSQGTLEEDFQDDLFNNDDAKSIEVSEVKVSATNDNLEKSIEKDAFEETPQCLEVIKKRKKSENSLSEIVSTNAKESFCKRTVRCEDCESKGMDETDMFFSSMAKTTKQLPVVEQAKIKLLLSNTVLRAQLKVNGDRNYLNYPSLGELFE